MRTTTMFMILLWLAVSLSGSAAEPPAAQPTPAPTTAPGSAAATTPGTAPAKTPGTSSGAASDSPATPDRIDPTEKVHSDTEISFPVDI